MSDTRAKRNRKANLFRKQNGLCFFCYVPMDLRWIPPKGPIKNNDATLDHLIHRLHGSRIPHNYGTTVLACHRCNHLRGQFRDLMAKMFPKENVT